MNVLRKCDIYGFPGGSVDKNSPAMQKMQIQHLDREDLREKGMATHSGILAWRVSWTAEPGGPQCLGSQSDVVGRMNTVQP